MILNGLFAWFMGIFSLVDPIVIPGLDSILNSFSDVIDIVVNGVSLLGLFIGDAGLLAISVYLGFVLALEVFFMTYQVIWFVLKKIPMLDIS